MATELAKAFVQIVPSAEGLGSTIKAQFEEAGDAAGTAGGNKAGGSFSGALGTAIKATGAMIAAAGTAVGSVVKSAVSGFADYEQLVGGLETMFEDLAWDVEENANRAFETAGLSANEYMETVMGFSAALNQSLVENEGNIARAAELSDQIITDMSDNANKMGTSMESIQNAYAGFAKGNYTMLDNLKLGYGGTKEEMERLLRDAEELAGLDMGTFSASNFADIAEAIHIVQTDIGITGTTAAEASTTISGSFNSMKAAWSNLVVGMADENANMEALIGNLVDSAGTLAGNLIPRIEQALTGVSTLIQNVAPMIVAMLPGLVDSILPGLLSAAMSIVQAVTAVLPDLLQTVLNTLIGMLPLIVDTGMQLFVGLIGAMPEIISTIVAALPEIITAIVDAITGNIPAIVMAGVTLLVALVENLPAIIAGVVAAIPAIISGLVNAIVGSVGQIKSAGYNLMMGFRDGIVSSVTALWNAMKDTVNYIVNGAKRLLGIASPSKVFEAIGGYTMQGFAEGILANEDLVKSAMADASALATGSFSSTLAISQPETQAAPASGAREIAEALRNVRVYLDGTRLVGYLVPDIDTALGVRQLAAERGAL